MKQSYASAALAATVATITSRRRDVAGEAVADAYIQQHPAQEPLQRRIERSTAFRERNKLPTVSSAELALDTSAAMSRSVFSRIVAATGIELLIKDDLITSRGSVNRSHLDAFIVRNSIIPAELQDTVTLHLTAEAPTVIADEDPGIAKRVQEAHQYVRSLIKLI